MKKLLSTIFVLAFTVTCAMANEQTTVNLEKQPACPHKMAPNRAKKAAAFEQKLGLTDDQKAQAKEIRQQGFEKLKPVLDQMKAKKQEARAVKNSRIAIKDQEEQLKKIDSEFKVLEKQAREIRKENMKEFESILTKDQKKILKQMKKEGRENFKKNHPPVYGRPVQPPVSK